MYGHLLRAQIRSQAAYRASFVLDLCTNALTPFIDVVVIVAMFRVTRSLGCFDAFEVLVMFGLASTAFCLADVAVGNIERIRVYVKMGLLDAVLVRPLSALGQLLAVDFTIRRITRLAITLGILGFAVHRAGVQWTPARVVLLVVTPLFGAMFFSAVFVAPATVAFWWIDSGEFANGFTYGGRDFTNYPATVFNGVFRRVFAYSLGFAFVSYYPSLGLLGRADPLGLPSWAAWCSPAVAIVAAALAALVWRSGVRHYRSTGS